MAEVRRSAGMRERSPGVIVEADRDPVTGRRRQVIRVFRGPVVPTPEEITKLVDAAHESRRPEHDRAILVAATTGL
jgi:hypothetical protein